MPPTKIFMQNLRSTLNKMGTYLDAMYIKIPISLPLNTMTLAKFKQTFI